MSSFPLVKFVDAPTASAVVRYDFNDQAATPAKKVLEFDPGVPTLEGDPDAVGQQWGFRSPQIVHTIKGTKAQAMAALSAVSKELLRRTNWVLFQPSAATQPVWFKTYRTGFQPVTLDQVYVRVDGGGTAPLPDTWRITVPLVADAFAYGARVTIPTAQIVQSPADLAGPTRYAMRYILPTIKGDAPTNLRVSFTPASSVAGNSGAWLVGSVSGPVANVDQVINIGNSDGFSAVGGTGAGVSNAAYFTSDYRAFSVGAATPNLLARLTGSFTGLPIGRYKVQLRFEVDATFTAANALFQLVVQKPFGVGTNPIAAVTVAAPLQTTGTSIQQGWVDLGEITVPLYQRPTTDAGLANGDFSGWSLLIGSSDGTALTGKIDAFRLTPIDAPGGVTTRLLKITSAQVITGTGTITIDGDSETYWATASGAYASPPPVNGLSGSFPVADPGQPQNVLEFMALNKGITGAGVTNYITAKDAQTAVDISYLPRYLHVGDGT